jgi:hypothetical protein
LHRQISLLLPTQNSININIFRWPAELVRLIWAVGLPQSRTAAAHKLLQSLLATTAILGLIIINIFQ